jgi:hypothetical protein
MQTNLNRLNPVAGAGVAMATFDWLRAKTDRLTTGSRNFVEGRRATSFDHSWLSLNAAVAFGALA